jgi:hypothetical protein
MQMSEIEDRKRALELLSEWVPRSVLGRARKQAEEMARDEYVRAYVARHALLLVLVLLASFGVSFLVVLCLALLVRWLDFVPSELLAILGALNAVLFFVIFLAPAIFLMFQLEKRALREMASEVPLVDSGNAVTAQQQEQGFTGPDVSFRDQRPEIPRKSEV